MKRKLLALTITGLMAFGGTVAGADQWNHQRFICAHCIMLGLEGVPALYIHSLLATGNDEHRVLHTGHNRAINRHKWDYEELKRELADSNSQHHRTYSTLQYLIRLRAAQPAFHPNATQYTLHINDQVFAFWRQSADRRQSIFALHNISRQPQHISLTQLNLIATNDWFDLISGKAMADLTGSVEG